MACSAPALTPVRYRNNLPRNCCACNIGRAAARPYRLRTVAAKDRDALERWSRLRPLRCFMVLAAAI
eukprot:scaffold1085_cov407-Prasinococcus_capsulatus_cf.AAC.58